MSYPDLSIQDFYLDISYEDLFVKERQYIDTADWEKLLEKNVDDHTEEESLDIDNNNLTLETEDQKEVDDQVPESEVSEILESLLSEEKLASPTSNFEIYRAECHKYNISPINLMQNIHEQKILDLNCFILSDLHIRIIFDHLTSQNLVNLTKIDLSENFMSPKSCNAIANYIEDSENLTDIILHSCLIGPDGVAELLEPLQDSTSIVSIDLSKCNLGDEGGRLLFEAMTSNDKCSKYNLEFNHLSSGCADALQLFLKTNQTVQDLNLQWNELYPEKECCVKMLKGLGNNQSIKKLNLAWNALTGKDFFKYLLKALKKCNSLQTLNLESNRFSSADALSLLKVIPKSQSIQELYLRGNFFTREDFFSLLALFDSTPSLKKLDFGKDLWNDKVFLDKAVTLQQTRPEIELIYQDRIIRKEPNPVDFKSIVLNRIKFLSDKAMKVKSKKKRWNFGDLMWEFKQKPDNEGVLSKDELKRLIKQRNYKLEDGTILDFASLYPFEVVASKGKQKKKKPKVALKLAAEEYIQRFNIPEPSPPKPKTRKGVKMSQPEMKVEVENELLGEHKSGDKSNEERVAK